jgi:hypothetical protein
MVSGLWSENITRGLKKIPRYNRQSALSAEAERPVSRHPFSDQRVVGPWTSRLISLALTLLNLW